MKLAPAVVKRIAKRIEAVLHDEIGGRSGFAIVFTAPPNYDEASYASNLERTKAISLLHQTATNIVANTN